MERSLPLAIALLAPSAAFAAGLWNFDQGASNYARGGANIAAPADPTAIYLNPAALAGVRGFQILGQADFIADRRTFEREPDAIGRPRFCCRKTEYESVANEQPVFPPSPGFYASGNFERVGLPQLTVGLALYGPPRSDALLDADGAQRYNLVESHNLQIHSALAAGYELPWKKTRVGLTAMMINQYVDTALALNSFQGGAEERSWDADIAVKARDEDIPAWIVGASVEPVSRVTLAVSYQHAYDVHAKGRAKGTIGEDLDELADLREGDLDVDFEMPAIARGAVRWDAARWNVETAFVYENWSRNDEVRFSPKQPGGLALLLEGGTGTLSVEDITVPTHFRDTWSLRVGGEWLAIPETLAIRSGVFYERAAISEEWINMGNFDLDKAGLSVGARWDIRRRGWVELGGGYQHWFPVEVSNSKVRIIDPINATERWPVANGRYSNARLQAMLGVGIRL